MPFERQLLALHNRAHNAAFSSYIRKGYVPPELMRIMAEMSSVEAFADLVRCAYNPDQPRVPAGNPDGGQWTSGGGGDDSNNTDATTTSSPSGALTGLIQVADADGNIGNIQEYSPDRSGWHNYVVGPTLICPASQNCTSQEIADQLARYAVPGQDPAVPVANRQASLVSDPRTGLPVGYVVTTISSNGLIITNTTQPEHIFYNGVVVRGAYQGSDGGWYVLTHGYGNNAFPDMAEVNQWQGPKVFQTLDAALRQSLAP